MDGRGRLAEPLTRPGNRRAGRRAGAAAAPRRVRLGQHVLPPVLAKIASRISRFMRFWALRLEGARIPRCSGIAASALFLVASIGYGAVRGDHVLMIVDTLKDWRDAGANSLGFRIAAVSFSGEKHVSRAEILAAAGVTGRTSLLFLDVEAARARLKTMPWIAEATVRKLLPDRLQIRVREREPFALWQVDGKLSLIAADGAVIGPLNDPAFAALPLVVGRGAQTKARDFLALLDRYPSIRDQVRAGVLVAERRWNLKLKNNVDIRLPETDIGPALDRLVALDRDKRLISRDILAIDLRLPDRVTVRLSDAAAQAREEARKPPKKKGGDA
jgi:cell division protein FtsQ